MKRFVFTSIVGGVIGALVFWLYQTTFQGNSITAFIGSQIISQGNYSLSPTVVGWAVHLGVSLSYGILLAFLAQILFPNAYLWNRVASLVAALILGWITTIIAPPAIQITIAILSGKDFPSPLWNLNPASGHPFWNHIVFFMSVWLLDTGFIRFFKENDQNLLDLLMSFSRKEVVPSNS